MKRKMKKKNTYNADSMTSALAFLRLLVNINNAADNVAGVVGVFGGSGTGVHVFVVVFLVDWLDFLSSYTIVTTSLWEYEYESNVV